jgi:hypothetical protein
MVQGGGVPSGQRAGPAEVGAGESPLSVPATVAQPVMRKAAMMNGLIRFMINP